MKALQDITPLQIMRLQRPQFNINVERWRVLLDTRGITQTQVAKEIEVRTSNLSGFVRGHQKPSWGVIERMAKAVGVEPDTFVDFYYDAPRHALAAAGD